jgi:hypothetical protein
MTDRTDAAGKVRGGVQMSSGEPALVRRWERASSRLTAQHRQLETFFTVVSEELTERSMASVRTAFSRLDDAVSAHLEIEEQVYLATLRRLHPDVSEVLRGLVEEHHAFRRRIEHLNEILDRGLLESFAGSFERLSADFLRHERREEEIVSALSRG